MPSGKRFIWPPPGDTDKQFHVEVAAPAAILRALGADIEIGSPRENLALARLATRPKSLEDWLATTSADAGGLILGGARSWNHPQLLMAARGLVFGDWGEAGKLLAMQAGRVPGEGAARLLDGEEPRSTDYDPFRWACGLIFASDRAPAEIREDARTVLRRQIGLALLGAVPWTDAGDEFRNARGEFWYRGPTLSPVGERSPKTSNPDQLGLFCRLALGRSDLCDRESWGGAVADLLPIEPLFAPLDLATIRMPNLALKLLDDAKVYGSFRFVEYPEGRLVMRPRQLNPNTPSALWSFADAVTKRQVRGFPFDPTRKNRGPGSPDSLGCAIEDGFVVARSTDERFTARFPLPASAPLWSVVIDENGARIESDAGPIAPPDPNGPNGPGPDPTDDPPPRPEIDTEALAAEVIALGAQPDQTDPAVALVRARRWAEAGAAVAGMMVPKKKVPDRDALAARLAALTAT